MAMHWPFSRPIAKPLPPGWELGPKDHNGTQWPRPVMPIPDPCNHTWCCWKRRADGSDYMERTCMTCALIQIIKIELVIQ